MEVEHFGEELRVLKKEMNGYMSFYKDTILSSIQQKKAEFQASLSGTSLSVN